MPHASVRCQGPLRRREFLRAGMLGLGGLGLSDLLAARSAAGTASANTSLILFWMWGGPSQLETFDPKPEAPSEYRGPFRPIATNVPGIDVCELFPQLAQRADKVAIVRSLHHTMSSHNDGSIELLTGKTPVVPDPTSTARSDHPDLGMIASRCRGSRRDGVPQYIGIPTQPFMTQPAYLGLSHKAYVTGDPSVDNFKVPDLSLSAGVDGQRLEDRRTLVAQFDRLQGDLDQNGSLDGMEQFRASAFTMLTSPKVRDAFDLNREPPPLRDRYGRHLWGQSCLLARRLAEAGAGVITIDALAPKPGMPLYFSWDDHANAQPGWDLATGMKLRADHMDPAIAALIDDLHARGLDKQVMVVAVGEFGRTPKLSQANGCLGRDHWPSAMSALVAGGGIRGGQVIGATTSKAEHPTERPLTPQDLLATIYRHLQIDSHREFADFAGRPIPILGEGTPIRELL
ncbi:MAG: DUF1501 domain-containing protein [Planctomycetaceae bacterium]|nr:DUF1501 domain-containing protein [Planctomycetaceae bacterium]